MVELYDYQREALTKLRTGSILCGGVGSGKSRTSLAYYYERECEGKAKEKWKPLYIITTARKRDTYEWEGELAIFDDVEAEAIDSWNNIKKYKDVVGAFFIFDEQRVVGYGAWTQAFLQITKHNEWILLSATPGDAWIDYVPVFIANGYFKNKTDFCNQHVIWARYSKYPQIKAYWQTYRLEQYRNDILVTMDYSRPTELHHETIPVMYDRMLYKTVQAKRWNIYEDKPIENVSEFCQVLRRIVNSDESRSEAIMNVIGEHPKVIIFYKYNFELDILRRLMIKNRIIFSEWNGHKHQPIPDCDEWAYLVQYTSGAEGWNSVATDTMIFYSDDYSYKVMVQAAGRIDRLNTPFHDLYYYHLRSTAPIDRAITLALTKKRNFNESKFCSKFSENR